MSVVTKVAIITGGTNGIGLAVAKSLAQRPGWQVYIMGTNLERGSKAASEASNITFLKGDVTIYDELAYIFQQVWSAHSRLDFVFANAGVSELFDFYTEQPDSELPPPEPDMKTLDINLKGSIYTSYLAFHYFRHSPNHGNGANIIFNGSCSSFYPVSLVPIYTATKHALLGFARSLAKSSSPQGIRINIICPGVIRTSICTSDFWDGIPSDLFVPLELVVRVVLLIVDGEGIVDSKGLSLAGDKTHGRAIEMSGDQFYITEPSKWCDDKMERLMTQYMESS